MRLLGSISQNGSKKYQKSNRVFNKSWWRFTTLRNIKKLLVKQRFGAPEKVDQNTLWNLWYFDDFEPKSQNGPQSDQKALGL